MAATRPAQVEPVSEPTMAAPNAPNSSWPSMAMFTTPDRSPSTPPRAPNTSGTATASEPPSRPTTGIVPPAAAHVRKPVIHATAKMTTSHSVVFFCLHVQRDRGGSAQRAHDDQDPGRRGRRHGHRRQLHEVAGDRQPERGVALLRGEADDQGQPQRQNAEHGRRLAVDHGHLGKVDLFFRAGGAHCGAHWASLAGQTEDRPDQRRSGDEQHDQRLDDQDDVDGDVLGSLHREAAGLEGAEQQAGPHDADRSRPAQQRDRDGVEADARVEVEGDAAGDGAEHLVDAGQADEPTRDEHHDDVGATDVDAGRAGCGGVLADGSDAEAEGGPVEDPPDHGDGDESEQEAEVQVVAVAQQLRQGRRVVHRQRLRVRRTGRLEEVLLRQRVEHQVERDVVEHDRDDHLVRAGAGLEEADQAAPERAGGHADQDCQASRGSAQGRSNW